MFTGLVAAIGRIESTAPVQGGLRMAIAIPPRAWADEPLVIGESIAIDGVCLTVAATRGDAFSADVSGETLRLTTLGARLPGQPVNLERALRAGDRLGGHLVSGHVDGLGSVRSIEDGRLSKVVHVQLPQVLQRFVAVKGSIAVDGISLTVNAVDGDGFTVSLIPHTLASTTLGERRVGDRVNIEVDTIARYVDRLMAVAQSPGGLAAASGMETLRA